MFMLKQQVIGHLGQDATANNVNGKQVINFSVAHTKAYVRGDGQKVNETVWVSCSWWTDSQKIAQYLKKGTHVFVEGEPNVTTYRNSQGVTLAQMTLRVSELQLLQQGNKQQNQNQASFQAQAPNQYTPASINDDVADDLPF
jgi:single-strand DNA-binding protein